MLALGAWLVGVVAHEAGAGAREIEAPAIRPSPVAWRVATVGHGSAAASLLWARTVVHYATADRPDPAWIREASLTATALDPEWNVPVRYGALMLADLGDLHGHESLLAEGARRWPGDPWFPTALGMSRWLHAGDAAGAARWLAFAAATPGADPILGHLAERAAAEAP